MELGSQEKDWWASTGNQTKGAKVTKVGEGSCWWTSRSQNLSNYLNIKITAVLNILIDKIMIQPS